MSEDVSETGRLFIVGFGALADESSRDEKPWPASQAVGIEYFDGIAGSDGEIPAVRASQVAVDLLFALGQRGRESIAFRTNQSGFGH